MTQSPDDNDLLLTSIDERWFGEGVQRQTTFSAAFLDSFPVINEALSNPPGAEETLSFLELFSSTDQSLLELESRIIHGALEDLTYHIENLPHVPARDPDCELTFDLYLPYSHEHAEHARNHRLPNPYQTNIQPALRIPGTALVPGAFYDRFDHSHKLDWNLLLSEVDPLERILSIRSATKPMLALATVTLREDGHSQKFQLRESANRLMTVIHDRLTKPELAPEPTQPKES